MGGCSFGEKSGGSIQGAAALHPAVGRHGGNVETYDDHRVAMAFSLIGLRTDGIVIENPACCRKTFEDYFTVLSELTGKKTEAEFLGK